MASESLRNLGRIQRGQRIQYISFGSLQSLASNIFEVASLHRSQRSWDEAKGRAFHVHALDVLSDASTARPNLNLKLTTPIIESANCRAYGRMVAAKKIVQLLRGDNWTANELRYTHSGSESTSNSQLGQEAGRRCHLAGYMQDGGAERICGRRRVVT